MKNAFVLFLTLFLLAATDSEAQIYSPQLAGHYGQRIIYYPHGYYQGNVYNGIANGAGTMYLTDGTFFYGQFSNGMMHGHGMIVSPYYGYMEGHWSMGQFVGPCPNQSHNRNPRQVESIVDNVQYNRPNDNRYADTSPEGYDIKRIDPNTQMGKTLLGRIGN